MYLRKKKAPRTHYHTTNLTKTIFDLLNFSCQGQFLAIGGGGALMQVDALNTNTHTHTYSEDTQTAASEDLFCNDLFLHLLTASQRQNERIANLFLVFCSFKTEVIKFRLRWSPLIN